tara:strand:+ start:51 stop:419 length:369 start_codon:yes stop_codon:yes gene_type:complete
MKLRAYLIRVGQRWALVAKHEPGYEVRFDNKSAALNYARSTRCRVTRRAGWDRADVQTPPTPVLEDELSPDERRQLGERLAVAQRARVRHVRARSRAGLIGWLFPLTQVSGWLYRRAVRALR